MADQAMQARLQVFIEQEVQKPAISNVFLGVESADHSVQFVGAAGMAHPNDAQPPSPTAPYFIASITKLYTAVVIAKLAQDGRLAFSDRITHHIPADLLDGLHTYKGVDYVPQITVGHLLRHTAGIADYFEGKPTGGRSLLDRVKGGEDVSFDCVGALGMARQLSPYFPPDSGKAHYSDTNYQLLGAIIQRVTGGSLGAAYQAYIFTPLGLKDTYLYDPAANQPEPATIYNKTIPLHIPQTMASFGPDGGLVSTLADQLRFVRGFFEGRLVDRAMLDQLASGWKPIFFPIIYYGAGLMRIKLPRIMSPIAPAPTLTGHAGSSNSFAFFAPDKGLYLVGTLNQVDSPTRGVQFMLRVIRAIEKARA